MHFFHRKKNQHYKVEVSFKSRIIFFFPKCSCFTSVRGKKINHWLKCVFSYSFNLCTNECLKTFRLTRFHRSSDRSNDIVNPCNSIGVMNVHSYLPRVSKGINYFIQIITSNSFVLPFYYEKSQNYRKLCNRTMNSHISTT